jgi:hypothetical protein
MSASGPDTADYERTASSISSAATAHRTAMASIANVSDCQTERDRYRAQVTPLVDHMQAMSGDMDSCMASMGHANAGSMGATCTSMRSELDRHMNAACASSAMSDNTAEATVHAQRMTTWANTESGQAAQLQSMMGGGGTMMGGSCQMR